MPLPSQVSLQVAAVPVLSYPMAYNRVGVLGPVLIRNDGSAVPGATLTITVTDEAGVLGRADLPVDLPGRGGTTLTALPAPLDADVMARGEQQRPGAVQVRVTAGAEALAEQTLDVQILAAGQWMASPATLGLEMLAAFAMPHHPAVQALLAEAVHRLGGTTGRDVLNAYADGPERVEEVARAVFEALRAHGIQQIPAPASWTEQGQLVRPPDQVLDGRVGTCLDTALVLAAALERAGLHPLVWVTDGHAFAGYWTDERSLPASATTDVDGVVNLVDLGLIRCLDTTMGAGTSLGGTAGGGTVVGGNPPVVAAGNVTFEQAQAATGPWLHGDLSGMVGVLDVRAARRDGIMPLPARVAAPDGGLQLITYTPPAPSPPSTPSPTSSPASLSVTTVASGSASVRAQPRLIRPGASGGTAVGLRPDAPPRVARWKNALLDLSLRNRLLNYSGRGAVSLAVPPGLLAAVEDVVNDGGAISLLPADQVSEVQAARGIRFGRELTEERRADLLTTRRSVYCDVPTETYQTRMRALVYRARTAIEETGANNLYLALGTLVWHLDGRDLRSPLVLVPVTVSSRTRHGLYRIELDESGTSTPNYCLLEKLRQVHGLQVPGLAEPAEDSAGIDLDAAFRAVRTALATAGLNYRVEQTADLSMLSFAKFRLWKDLDEHWSDLAANPLVSHLVSSPTTAFTDPAPDGGPADLDALAGQLPIGADASQLDAVAAAGAGHTFVLEGPPGTGKSQTITNLLAREIAEGRRVLFVAEKRAALDVVTRRLEAIGLAPFCLDLHDKGAKPAVVRAQIRAALELRVAADEQGLAAAGEQLRSAAAALARYADRLHKRNAAGLSYYSAHTQALAVADAEPLPVPRQVVASASGLPAVRAALQSLPDVADPARPRPGHPWGFVDPEDPAGVDAAVLADAAARVDEVIDTPLGATEVAAALQVARSPAEVAALAGFAGGWAVDLALLDDAATDRWRLAAEQAAEQLHAFAAAEHPGLDVVRPEVFGMPVDALDADARAAAASSWFGRKKRQLAVLARLDPVLRPGTSVHRKQIAALTGQLAGVWKQIVQWQVRLAEINGLTPPDDWNPLLPQGVGWLEERIAWLRGAAAAASLRDPAGRPLARPEPFRLALRQLLESRAVVGLSDREMLDRLSGALTGLAGLCGGDRPFLVWSAGSLTGSWLRTRAEREVSEPGQPGLRRWLSLLHHLQPLRAGLEQSRQALLTGAVRADRAAAAFDAGVAAASVAERGAATGLDGFEPSAQNRGVRQFAAAADRVRGQLTTAIPARVLAGRSFDAGSGLGRVGELSRELAKQRRGLAVRPLLARYGELITAVMPCMLVSPDSLARFFPPRAGLFDLVVFDEASQIRVADAIGALGRARSAVVVGDSRQMPPTSVAESTGADDVGGFGISDGGDGLGDLGDFGDVASVADEESILSECVQAGVPRRWLSWHYRSQDEALIAFSNRRYYDDRLSSFPSPTFGPADPGIQGHGISLLRVDGSFLRSGAGKLLRTNPVEADAVVAEIRRRFDAGESGPDGDPDSVPSIGVVTFNAQQRTHIESLLRDLADERITEALDRTDGEGLFVKNLENVQGDERDVILFSTAFSANARGVLPLNFGPLNQIGGERRLNVAITRARRQVLVFSSFDPGDLRAEETSSQGIKDLRAYLELARSGADAVIGSSPRAPVPDRHRDEVAAAVAARGLAVATTVGLSDFTLDLAVGAGAGASAAGAGGGDGHAASAPRRLAVLLDGPEWAARRTVGDRDGLPVEVLSGLMHWPAVERVWLPEWLRDKESVLARLEAAASGADGGVTSDSHPPGAGGAAVTGAVGGDAAVIEAAEDDAAVTGGGEGGGAGAVADDHALDTGVRAGLAEATTAPLLPGIRTTASASTGSSGGGPSPDHLPGETPFAPWISGYLGSRYVLDRLPDAAAAAQVRRALEAGITAEGPVHVDRLVRLVAGGFDLGRISADRRDAIVACLPAGTLRDPGDPQFRWPESVDPMSWNGFRRTGSHTDRPLEHIPTREIGNAMVAICIAGAGVDRDQLELETLHVFGFRRRTVAVLAELEAALRRAVTENRLRVNGALVKAC